MQKETPKSEELPVSAGLLKRLAEAADGNKDGLYHYFISNRKFPFDLVCPNGEKSAANARTIAEEILKQKNGGNTYGEYSMFGPFLTKLEDEVPINYEAIEIRFLKKTKSAQKNPEISPRLEGADAVILSMSAFDKFFLPYYLKLYGIKRSNKIREMVKETLLDHKLAFHSRCTIIRKPGGEPIA